MISKSAPYVPSADRSLTCRTLSYTTSFLPAGPPAYSPSIESDEQELIPACASSAFARASTSCSVPDEPLLALPQSAKGTTAPILKAFPAGLHRRHDIDRAKWYECLDELNEYIVRFFGSQGAGIRC